MAKDNSKTGAYQPLPLINFNAFGATTKGGGGSTPVGLGPTVGNNAMGLTNQSLGITAKSPINNVQAKDNTIPANQTLPVKSGGNIAYASGANNSDATKVLQDELVKGNYMQQSDLDNGGYGIYGPKTTAAVAKRDAELAARKNQSSTTTPVADGSGRPIVPPADVTTPPVTTPSDTTTPVTTPTNTTPPGLISSLVGTAGSVQPAVNDTAAQINTLRQGLQLRLAGLNATPGPQNIGLGQASAYQNAEAQQESALQGKLSNIISGASTAGGLYGTAAGLMPEALKYGAFGNTNVATGGTGGTTGVPVIDTAVQNAYNLIQNGSTVNDAISMSGLSQFGIVGSNALNAKLGVSGNTGTSGFNPTSQNATANQNATQSATYQGAATDLDTSLKQLDIASQSATNFLTAEKLLNPTDNPNWNAGINTYVGTFKNPADKLAYNVVMGDIKKFTSTILASNNGTIPTDVTNTLQSFDPSTLSAAQLQPYLAYLKQLGSNQLAVLQGQSTNSKNAGTTGYSGAPATVNTTPITGPAETSVGGSQIDNPYIQGVIGTGMNWGGAVVGFFKGIFDAIMKL